MSQIPSVVTITKKISALFYDHLLSSVSTFLERSDLIQFPQADRSLPRIMGIAIGSKLALKLVESEHPFMDSKDAVKCVCKDFWYYCFKQQASRLQANKKGVFVVHDYAFTPLQTLAKCTFAPSSPILSHYPLGSMPQLSPAGISERKGSNDESPMSSKSTKLASTELVSSNPVMRRTMSILELYAGMIEGFLLALGFDSAVTGAIGDKLPSCAFQITIRQSSSMVLDPARLLSMVPNVEKIDDSAQL
jgi:hypothetical protein